MPYGVAVQLPRGERRYGENDGGRSDHSGVDLVWNEPSRFARLGRVLSEVEGMRPPLRDLFMPSRTVELQRFRLLLSSAFSLRLSPHRLLDAAFCRSVRPHPSRSAATRDAWRRATA